MLEKRSRQEIHSDLQAGVRLTTFSPTMNVGGWCKSEGEELKSQHLTWKPIKESYANSADPYQTPHNVASIQGLHCLLKGFSMKIE